jgi:hypothetical protein
MTRDEIIRTALADTMLIDGIEQVARAAYEAGVAAEREACAKRLEAVGCDHCAANIRARGEK